MSETKDFFTFFGKDHMKLSKELAYLSQFLKRGLGNVDREFDEVFIIRGKGG